MKSFEIGYVIGCILVLIFFGVLIISKPAHASERCVKDSNGGVCCWNTDEEGTLKPPSCY